MATRKCTVTMKGLAGSSARIRIRPIPAWINTTTTASAAGHSTPRSVRARRHATHAVARIRSPATAAARRCEYSISVLSSKGGIHEPKHLGQSGQASPDPVARTTPPMATRARVEAAAAADSRRRRVTGRVYPDALGRRR
jgi:hypothetical protein